MSIERMSCEFFISNSFGWLTFYMFRGPKSRLLDASRRHPDHLAKILNEFTSAFLLRAICKTPAGKVLLNKLLFFLRKYSDHKHFLS